MYPCRIVNCLPEANCSESPVLTKCFQILLSKYPSCPQAAPALVKEISVARCSVDQEQAEERVACSAVASKRMARMVTLALHPVLERLPAARIGCSEAKEGGGISLICHYIRIAAFGMNNAITRSLAPTSFQLRLSFAQPQRSNDPQASQVDTFSLLFIKLVRVSTRSSELAVIRFRIIIAANANTGTNKPTRKEAV